MLAVGGVSAVLGVLYALMQSDLKRLLAYSTIENIGIIFVGAWAGARLQGQRHAGGGGAGADRGACSTCFNHSLFKSLLFFGAGAVLHATGERDMEQLGGLIHRMPQTAFAFLVGAVAISALPPFNGFVSEWLTFQAILLSPQLPQWGLKLLMPAVGALLALSAALAAACFVRAFGITFLGRPRSAAVGRAHETDRLSLAAMFALAALCLVAGILPGVFIDALAPVVQGLVGAPHAGADRRRLAVDRADRARAAAPTTACWCSCSSRSRRSLAAWRSTASRPTGCAARRPGIAAFRIPARSPNTPPSSFAQPIRRVFGTPVFRAREHVDMPPPGDMRPARLTVDMRDLVWDTLYAPIAAGVMTRRRAGSTTCSS